MPIYEYHCKACGTRFSRDMLPRQHDKFASFLEHQAILATSAAQEVGAGRCPRCNDIRVEQLLCSPLVKPSRPR